MKKIMIVVAIIAFVGILILINVFLNSQNDVETKNGQNINNQENGEKSKVLEVTSQTFEEEVLNSEKPVLIDFYADWCGPCKLLSPTVEEISKEKEDVKFVKINIDEAEDLAIKYEIMSIPTLVFIKDGKEEDRIIGVVDKTTILELIK